MTKLDPNDAFKAGVDIRAKADERWSKKQKQKAKSNGSAVESGEQLLNEVYNFIGRFVAYPSVEARIAHALWILHTHLMPAWESTPRIAFLSPEKETGKTRALEVSATVVPNPVEAINVTPAYLFRKVGDHNGLPTILYDEIDTVFGWKVKKDNEEIRALLNAGHRRGAISGRCVTKGRKIETEEVPAYCAVALAGLHDLPDTIMSRSVPITMKRRSPDEIIEAFRPRVHEPEGHALRDRISFWARSVLREATAARPEIPPAITDRSADVWEPLLVIADLAGGEWPDRARVTAVTLVTLAKGKAQSLGIRLLQDIDTVMRERESVSTKDLLQDLCNLPESLWNDIKGKPLNERQLANRLKPYGIEPKQVRPYEGNPLQVRGYRKEDFHDAWLRYLGSLSPPIEASHPSQASQDDADLFDCEE